MERLDKKKQTITKTLKSRPLAVDMQAPLPSNDTSPPTPTARFRRFAKTRVGCFFFSLGIYTTFRKQCNYESKNVTLRLRDNRPKNLYTASTAQLRFVFNSGANKQILFAIPEQKRFIPHTSQWPPIASLFGASLCR